jgi:hypothetical protein
MAVGFDAVPGVRVGVFGHYPAEHVPCTLNTFTGPIHFDVYVDPQEAPDVAGIRVVAASSGREEAPVTKNKNEPNYSSGEPGAAGYQVGYLFSLPEGTDMAKAYVIDSQGGATPMQADNLWYNTAAGTGDN